MIFQMRYDAIGEWPDSIDDYMRMFERTARDSLYTSARDVIKTFWRRLFVQTFVE